ncbi:MAG: hypothetical protein FWF28_00130, partial [Micrococcales bacterium]|nr:hypothetical protein [Micrococcales bacterium]
MPIGRAACTRPAGDGWNARDGNVCGRPRACSRHNAQGFVADGVGDATVSTLARALTAVTPPAG